MASYFSLANITKFIAGDDLSRRSNATNDYSLSHGVRGVSVAALGAAVPQAVDDLKQSITTSDILAKAYSATKVVLELTNDAPSFLPQLNSVASGILLIIRHFEVSLLSLPE
jgi:hypothetical protein